MPGDRGFDPMGLGASADAMKWYRQAELQHARWAMLGVAGVLAQSVLVPDVWWYDAALHLPAGLGPVNLGSTLAIQFLLMHFVEIRRWQDIRKPGSVSSDPIFTNNKLPAGEVGYPGASVASVALLASKRVRVLTCCCLSANAGGIFDPLGFAKGDAKALDELKTKELKNGAPESACGQRASHTARRAHAHLVSIRQAASPWLPSWASSSARRPRARARWRTWATTSQTRSTTCVAAFVQTIIMAQWR